MASVACALLLDKSAICHAHALPAAPQAPRSAHSDSIRRARVIRIAAPVIAASATMMHWSPKRKRDKTTRRSVAASVHAPPVLQREPNPCIDEAFHIAQIDGKGYGVVASRELQAGELILTDAPLLLVASWGDEVEPAPNWLASVEENFDALPVSDQKKVLSLHDAFAGHGEQTVAGIVRTNQFDFMLNRAGEVSAGAVFLNISRFNHSCCPNCMWTWDETTGSMQVRTATEIQAGEELCFSYIDLLKTRKERAAELLEWFRFDCTCPACSVHAPDESDRCRQRLRELTSEIVQVGQQKPRRGIELINDALRLFDDEGLQVLKIKKVLSSYAYEFALQKKELGAAKYWATQTHRLCSLCFGEDHAECLEWSTCAANLVNV